MKENPIRSLPGIPLLLLFLAAMLAASWWFVVALAQTSPLAVAGAVLLWLTSVALMAGLYMVEPNQAAVLSLFGRYVGTVKENGLRWNNIFFAKRKVSQR